MSDVRELKTLLRDPKIWIPTLVALLVGAAFGVAAYSNGWLG